MKSHRSTYVGYSTYLPKTLYVETSPNLCFFVLDSTKKKQAQSTSCFFVLATQRKKSQQNLLRFKFPPHTKEQKDHSNQ